MSALISWLCGSKVCEGIKADSFVTILSLSLCNILEVELHSVGRENLTKPCLFHINIVTQLSRKLLIIGSRFRNLKLEFTQFNASR